MLKEVPKSKIQNQTEAQIYTKKLKANIKDILKILNL